VWIGKKRSNPKEKPVECFHVQGSSSGNQTVVVVVVIVVHIHSCCRCWLLPQTQTVLYATCNWHSKLLLTVMNADDS